MAEQAIKEKSLSKNTAWYLIYNVLNVIFPLLTGIYVARVLLPDAIGQVSYAQNIASYFSILAFLGIPTYGLREIAKVKRDQEARNKLFSELYIINLISTIFFSCVYLGVVFIVPEFRDNLALYLVAGTIIVINALNISWLYEGMEEFKFESVRNLLCKAAGFVALVLLVRGEGDSLWYASILTIGTGLNYIVNMIAHRKFARFTFKNLNFKRHLKPIFFLVAVNLAIEIYTLVDTTMVGIFCPDKNVAFYVYGNKIYKIFLQIVNTFTMVVVPRLAEYWADKKTDKFNDILSKTLRIVFMIAIPLVIGIFFVGDLVITILYTGTYYTSSVVLKILSFILILSPVGYLLGSRVCLVTGHEWKMLISVGIGAVVNIICNFFLIQLFQSNASIIAALSPTGEGVGEYGAAIASVISEIIVMIIYICQGKKYFKLSDIFNNVLKFVLAANIMMCVLYVLGWFNYSWTSVEIANQIIELLIKFIGAALVYFGSLLLLQEKDVMETWNKFKMKLKRN